MTSKEAVERLLNSPTVKIRHGSYLDIELIKSIKQDLEVLEILRKHIKNKVDWNKHILKIYETTIYAYDVDDFNKIKEWLQNDK